MLGNRIKRIIAAVTIIIFVAVAFICIFMFWNKKDKEVEKTESIAVDSDLLCVANIDGFEVVVPSQYSKAVENDDMGYTYWCCSAEEVQTDDIVGYIRSQFKFPSDTYPETESSEVAFVIDKYIGYTKYGKEMDNRILPVVCLYVYDNGMLYKFSNENVWYYTETVQQELEEIYYALRKHYNIPWVKLIKWDDDVFDSTAPYCINEVNNGYTDEVFFDIDKETGYITKFNYGYGNVPTRVVIPNVIKGVTVKGVASECFYGYNEFSRIEEIVLPDTVTILGDKAFMGCDRLNKIHFLGDICYIGEKTFEGCLSLKEITVPSGVTELRSKAFKGCTDLETVRLLCSEVKIADDCFEGCEPTIIGG